MYQDHEGLWRVHLGHMSIPKTRISHCVRDDAGEPFMNLGVIVPS